MSGNLIRCQLQNYEKAFNLSVKNEIFFAEYCINCISDDNIGDLVPPVAVFWYRRFTLSDFSYRLSGTAPESVL